MAQRRMFTKEITNSSDFIKMSSSAQALYFHLNMASDDDGFCNEVDTCMFRAKASEDDLKVLIAKRFVLAYEKSSVIVIKHWRMNNLLRKDRHHETKYQELKEQLFLKDNGSYTFNSNEGTPLLNKPKDIEEIECKDAWQPNDNQMATEISKGKDRLGKDSIVEYSEDKDNKEEKIDREKDVHTHDYINSNNTNINNSDDESLRVKLIKALEYLDKNNCKNIPDDIRNKLIIFKNQQSMVNMNEDEQELYLKFRDCINKLIYNTTDSSSDDDDLPF